MSQFCCNSWIDRNLVANPENRFSQAKVIMGLDARKPVFEGEGGGQQRRRPACAIAQSDQLPCFSLKQNLFRGKFQTSRQSL